MDSESIFRCLYNDSTLGAFWLDSSSSHGRFSYMGDATGPLGHVLEYFTTDDDTAVAEETVFTIRKGEGPNEEVVAHHGQSILAYIKSQVHRSFARLSFPFFL